MFEKREHDFNRILDETDYLVDCTITKLNLNFTFKWYLFYLYFFLCLHFVVENICVFIFIAPCHLIYLICNNTNIFIKHYNESYISQNNIKFIEPTFWYLIVTYKLNTAHVKCVEIYTFFSRIITNLKHFHIIKEIKS